MSSSSLWYADIRDRGGNSIGSARFEQTGEDVKVLVQVRSLPPGPHGIHVHETGSCQAPDFDSAGAHLNPGGQPHHGSADGSAQHSGDLPKLIVGTDGTGRLEATLPGVTLRGKGHHSLFQEGGTSIVIHRDEDDMKTAPSGNAGERIACGVISEGRN